MKGLALDNGHIAAGAFDFDGNILQAPTTHFYKQKSTGEIVEVSAYEVDQNPSRFFGNNADFEFINGDPEQSLRKFRCVSPYGNHDGFDGLIQDVEQALSDDMLSPSFSAFKDIFLVKGRIWSLITARGNSPDNFQRAFQIINKETLSEDEREEQIENIRNNFGLSRHDFTDTQVLQHYFRDFVVDYVCCNNTILQRQMGLHESSGPRRKTQAMKWWMQEVDRKLHITRGRFSDNTDSILTQYTPIAWGFSDDSIGNAVEMSKFLERERGDDDKGRVYFTGDTKRFSDVESELEGFQMQKIKQDGSQILQVRV